MTVGMVSAYVGCFPSESATSQLLDLLHTSFLSCFLSFLGSFRFLNPNKGSLGPLFCINTVRLADVSPGGSKRFFFWKIVVRELHDRCCIFQPTNPNQVQIKKISKVAVEEDEKFSKLILKILWFVSLKSTLWSNWWSLASILSLKSPQISTLCITGRDRSYSEHSHIAPLVNWRTQLTHRSAELLAYILPITG